MTQESVTVKDPVEADGGQTSTTPAAESGRQGIPPIVLRAGTLLAGLVLWAVLGAAEVFHPSLFPPPWEVGVTLLSMMWDGELFRHIAVSLSRVFIGFTVATVIAIPLGIAMGLSNRVFLFVEPIVEFLRPVPPLALIPLAVVWFGIGWGVENLSHLVRLLLCHRDQHGCGHEGCGARSCAGCSGAGRKPLAYSHPRHPTLGRSRHHRRTAVGAGPRIPSDRGRGTHCGE